RDVAQPRQEMRLRHVHTHRAGDGDFFGLGGLDRVLDDLPAREIVELERSEPEISREHAADRRIERGFRRCGRCCSTQCDDGKPRPTHDAPSVCRNVDLCILAAMTIAHAPIRTPLTRNQIRGFWAAWGGWALDGMDSFIYSLVLAPALTE